MDAVAGDDDEVRKQLSRPRSALSGIFGPDGRPVTEPLVDDEGIVSTPSIDLNRCIQPKQMHDILGHYNRFDIFSLHVDNTPRRPVTFAVDPETHTAAAAPAGDDAGAEEES
ncbi:hypothetical protein ACU686_45225 [Yinghuangia aomiensis]